MQDTVAAENSKTVAALNFLDPEHNDILFVYWNLIDNFKNEQYVPSIFVKERLCGIVDRLFAIDRQHYFVELTGDGEPTLYPFFAPSAEKTFFWQQDDVCLFDDRWLSGY